MTEKLRERTREAFHCKMCRKYTTNKTSRDQELCETCSANETMSDKEHEVTSQQSGGSAQ